MTLQTTFQTILDSLQDAKEKSNRWFYNCNPENDYIASVGAAHFDTIKLAAMAALEGEKVTDLGIRFAGIPAGSEFTSLINGLVMVSNRDSGLSQATRDFLKGLTQPVFLQVFVTPT